MKLQRGIALVTGAGHRVGRALAVALGAERMTVAVHYNSSADEAEETVKMIEQAGGSARTFHSNLVDDEGPSRLVRDVVTAFGKLDVLVNSAAEMKRHAYADVTVKEWDTTIALNLRAPFRSTGRVGCNDRWRSDR